MRYWRRIDANGKTTTVESYSHDFPPAGAVEILQGEFEDYINRLPVPPETKPRDLAREIDEIKAFLGIATR